MTIFCLRKPKSAVANMLAAKLEAISNAGGVYKASIWSMLEGSRELHEECQLEGDGGSRAVRWHPREHSKLATVEDGCLIAWQLAGGVAKVTPTLLCIKTWRLFVTVIAC